ncbi:hypothetical protein EVA_17283 [gut metagenome]|uniref:Uncharacterized protein n=1 Tax=gut metagenome TaxID=749906 RepID=J9G544_9ZZZZ
MAVDCGHACGAILGTTARLKLSMVNCQLSCRMLIPSPKGMITL